MAASLRLYETVDELAVAREFLDEHAEEIRRAGGELPAELEAILDAAYESFERKVERVALFVRELQRHADANKEKASHFTARAQAGQRAAEGMKRYLLRQLERAAVASVKGTLASVRVQANPPAVRQAYTSEALVELMHAGVICDEPSTEGAHPLAPYVTVQLTASIDAKALLAAWREREAQLRAEAAGLALTDGERSAAEEVARWAAGQAVADGEALTAEEVERGVLEAFAERLAEKRAAHVADALAREFPGITVERNSHIRIS